VPALAVPRLAVPAFAVPALAVPAFAVPAFAVSVLSAPEFWAKSAVPAHNKKPAIIRFLIVFTVFIIAYFFILFYIKADE
jgi:hypothetical protein